MYGNALISNHDGREVTRTDGMYIVRESVIEVGVLTVVLLIRKLRLAHINIIMG